MLLYVKRNSAYPSSLHIFLTGPDSSVVLDLHQSQGEQWMLS